ncbi:MAG TPA: hypothetical protein VGD98_04865 [Ktedonobacteraceae bacterium]
MKHDGYLRDPECWRLRGFTATLCVLLVLLAGCGFQQRSQMGSTQFPTQTERPAALSGMLTQVHMLDAQQGWVVSWQLAGDGSYHILHTTDGGWHWQDVLTCRSTVDQGKGFIKPCSTNFYSATVATITQPEYDQSTRASHVRIFHTADAGQHWQSAELKATDLQTPATFIDALHGWAFVTEKFPGGDPGSTYIGQEIAVYRTIDGGQSWQRAAHGPATSQLPGTSDDGYGLAPLVASAQMAFFSPTTGWLMGRTYGKNSQQAWLYLTHDGGMSWQRSSLVFSSAEDASWAPVFFNGQDGVLLGSVFGPAPQYSQTGKLYVTHDGGQTWSGRAVPLMISNGASIDLQQAWTISDNQQLYITHDGWQHWSTIHVQPAFKNITSFNFISPTVGWALANSREHFAPEPGGGATKGDVITLLKTTDGGQTWQETAFSRI